MALKPDLVVAPRGVVMRNAVQTNWTSLGIKVMADAVPSNRSPTSLRVNWPPEPAAGKSAQQAAQTLLK
ncbi:hypothetical protein KCP74_00165 [Salmonella enterica subsp. enterica]|nr:hypothetical protein KCP74_00165 [Salmonella enterica subsp. enterica]